jgi:hypothetical protein
MDPRTARPVQGMLTVAILSATGTEGDALDDAFSSKASTKAAPGSRACLTSRRTSSSPLDIADGNQCGSKAERIRKTRARA